MKMIHAFAFAAMAMMAYGPHVSGSSLLSGPFAPEPGTPLRRSFWRPMSWPSCSWPLRQGRAILKTAERHLKPSRTAISMLRSTLPANLSRIRTQASPRTAPSCLPPRWRWSVR